MSDDYGVWQTGNKSLDSIIEETKTSEPKFNLYMKYRRYVFYQEPKPKAPKEQREVNIDLL